MIMFRNITAIAHDASIPVNPTIARVFLLLYLIIFVFIAEFGLGGDETLSLAIMVEYLPLKNSPLCLVKFHCPREQKIVFP